MNGDFLALLPKASFPQLVASAPAHAPLQGTTVFAFHCAEGVVIAGDHRATSGTMIFTDKAEKILELDSHSIMAIAGVPAVAFEMARTLQTTFEFYRRSQLQTMSLAAKVRALSKLLHDNLPATLQGVGAVAPIFAGVESGADGQRPIIYFYDMLGAQFEATNFAASGSGSTSIRSVLHYLGKWGNPRPEKLAFEQAALLANRILLTAAEFDAATGGVHPDRHQFATIKLLSAAGIRTITLAEQEQFWGRGRDES